MGRKTARNTLRKSVPEGMIMPPGPPVSEAAIDFCSGVTLETCSEIDDYFHREKAQSYIKWFNATLGNKSPWGGVQLVDTAQNELGFHRFWNRINQIFGGSINLIQFVSLMSILSNEVRGDFTPQAEKMGFPAIRASRTCLTGFRERSALTTRWPETKQRFSVSTTTLTLQPTGILRGQTGLLEPRISAGRGKRGRRMFLPAGIPPSRVSFRKQTL